MSIEENTSHSEQDEIVVGPENTRKHRSKKNRNMLILLAFCAVVGGGGAIYLTQPKEVTANQASTDLDKRLEKASGQKVHPSLANRRDYGQDFASKVEGEVGGIKNEVKSVDGKVDGFNQQVTEFRTQFAQFLEMYQQDKDQRQLRDEDLQAVLDAQAQAQLDLENRLNDRQGFPAPVQQPKAQTTTTTTNTTPATPQGSSRGVERTEFTLTPINLSQKVKHRSTDRFIPAGSYAEGRIIMGAKTSAAVDAQSDPRPILIRVTGMAQGPIVNGQHTETDTVGCTITASAYGDISSEQGHAKLQEMSCAISKTESKTVRVYGYIGHRGSYGVHSEVVMREGDLAQRAFWAGMLANTGDSLGLLVGETSKSAVGTVNTASGIKDAGLNMFTGGMDEAGTQLSSYYIKRLEQIQPIIPLKAGTPITIVFMKEVALEGDDTPQAQPQAVASNNTRQRIPLDANSSDISPDNINQQVMSILQKHTNPAPNKTNWNNELY